MKGRSTEREAEEDLEEDGWILSYSEAKRAAQNRVRWRGN